MGNCMNFFNKEKSNSPSIVQTQWNSSPSQQIQNMKKNKIMIKQRNMVKQSYKISEYKAKLAPLSEGIRQRKRIIQKHKKKYNINSVNMIKNNTTSINKRNIQLVKVNNNIENINNSNSNKSKTNSTQQNKNRSTQYNQNNSTQQNKNRSRQNQISISESQQNPQDESIYLSESLSQHYQSIQQYEKNYQSSILRNMQ